MARLPTIIAVFVAVVAADSPALAQEAGSEAQNAVIGPPQLRDFSLNGTVTREAEQQPPATQQRPAPPPQQQESAQPRRTPELQAPQPRLARQERERQSAALPAPSTSNTFDFSTPTPAQPGASGLLSGASPQAAPAAEPTASVETDGSPALLPWLLAALAAAAAASFLLRRRSRESFAGVGASAFEPPPETVTAPPPAPAPAPRATSASGGVVSTRLRPWIELDVTPGRAIVDEEKAAIELEVVAFNSGSVPARAVTIEAALINAGPHQDQQIGAFFNFSLGEDEGIDVPPMQKVSIRTAVFLPRNQLRPIEIEGRALFVPMIAFNARYGWSGGRGQTSASYLVGKTTSGEKLAPFRLDIPPRLYRGLAVREHELRVRS